MGKSAVVRGTSMPDRLLFLAILLFGTICFVSGLFMGAVLFAGSFCNLASWSQHTWFSPDPSLLQLCSAPSRQLWEDVQHLRYYPPIHTRAMSIQVVQARGDATLILEALESMIRQTLVEIAFRLRTHLDAEWILVHNTSFLPILLMGSGFLTILTAIVVRVHNNRDNRARRTALQESVEGRRR